jgi:site-specific DNA-methyltransferase (adenine-specific)
MALPIPRRVFKRAITRKKTVIEQAHTPHAQPEKPDWLNRLHQVDASEFVRQLPAQSIDMLLTDPPYCSGGLHVAARTQTTSTKYINSSTQEQYEDFDFDNMDQRSWQFWCQGWLSGAFRALKPGGLVVCFIDWRQLPALTDVIQASGFTLRGIAVWDKTIGRARPRNGGFKQQAEFIVWASKGALPACSVYLPGVFQSRLQFPKRHMTEKPVEIGQEVVRLVPAGGTVLDLFSGSGTFLLAAKEAGLNWVGCELNPRIYAGAEARLAA